MKHKRGDTFHYVAVLKAPVIDGEFAGWQPKCQIRDMRGELVAEVVAEWVDPVTARSVTLSVESTETWKTGNFVFDVQFTRETDGFVRSSGTVIFYVVDDVTRP